MKERIKHVAFVDHRIREAYLKLQEGAFEDKKLFEAINRAIDNLKNNPLYGTRVPSQQVPKEYVKRYQVTNLWKCDLPNAWRLIYTIKGDDVEIVSMILEWMTHKEYERRFNY